MHEITPCTTPQTAGAELAAPPAARRAATRLGRRTGSLRHPVTGRASSDLLRRPRGASSSA